MDDSRTELTISEADVVRLILEFLENRDLVSSLVNLERETGVTNPKEGWSEDIQLLKQLVTDGSWPEVWHFLKPLEDRPEYYKISLIITKHQYIEALDSATSRPSAAKELTALRTRLTKEFNVNPEELTFSIDSLDIDRHRMNCFQQLLPTVLSILGASPKEGGNAACSQNERLVQLLVKGLLYESCIDFCQAAATDSEVSYQPTSSLLTKSTLSNVDVSLLSWLYALPQDTFSFSFAQRSLQVNLDRLPARPTTEPAEAVENSTNSLRNNQNAAVRASEEELLAPCHYEKIGHLEDIQAIRAVAVHPSGTMLAIGSNSRVLRVCLWPEIPSRTATITPLKVIGQVPRHHAGSIYCIAWHPNGRLIASGSNDKLVKLIRFDPDCTISNKSPLGPTAELDLHSGTVRDVCFLAPDNSGDSAVLLSAGAGDCRIEASDVTTRQSIAVMLGHTMPVFSLTTMSASEFISAGQDKTWRLWDLRQRPTLVHSTSPDSTFIASVHTGNVDHSANSHRYLVTGHNDGSVRLWDLRRLQTSGESVCVARSIDAHQNEIRSVRIKPGCTTFLNVLSASYDNTLAITQFDPTSKSDAWQGSYTVGQHMAKAVTARWNPVRDAFVSSSADRSCAVWAAATLVG